MEGPSIAATAGMGRLDARTALLGPGGSENITLSVEVQEVQQQKPHNSRDGSG